MWLRFSRRLFFYIPPTSPAAPARRVTAKAPPSYSRSQDSNAGSAGAATPNPRTHYSSESKFHCSGTRHHHHHHRRSPGRILKPGDPLPPPPINEGVHGSSEGYVSQREAYRQRRSTADSTGDSFVDKTVAGSLFTPLPRSYGFYEGIDEHARQAPRPSREARQQQLRESLEARAASVVEFTDGGEEDIELNGLPADQYHGHAGWTTIPKDSALYSTMYDVGDLESRQRTNSWSVAVHHSMVAGGCSVGDRLTDSSAASLQPLGVHQEGSEQAPQEVLDDRRRRRQHDEGLLSTSLEGELLAPMQESVGQPRSTYAMRKLFVDGLVGYQGVITRAEEATMCEELLHLLQDPRAAYVAEEARYCVNLYEKALGIPGKDTLAFALSSCRTLQRVLHRFFFLGLIPSVPNVCQVSEMVGTFSGYPVHRHPPSIGPYVGVLNLVSTSVLHLQHKDAPWYPRLHLTPRSLFVVTEPCLTEYAMGYKQTHQPFHAFEYATRVSKDYRIEVLFATVEAAQAKTLSEAVHLTEYAEQQAREGMTKLPPGSMEFFSEAHTHPTVTKTELDTRVHLRGRTDEWLQRLRDNLHASEDAKGGGHAKPVDGHALRRQLLAEHLIGDRPRSDNGDDGVAWESEAGVDRGAQVNAADSQTGARCPEKGTWLPAKPNSMAQRRLAALKARYSFAQELKASQQRIERANDGPRLIRGHAPRDRLLEVIRPQAAGARNKLAGLSVTLPPLCAWGACAGSGRTAEGLNPRHGSSNPYNELWAPIESYVARVNAVLSDMGGKGTPGMTLSNSSPPLCLALRLFPDLTIAQLPALPRRSKEDRHAPRRARNSFIAPHEYPLDAILGAEALWGGGADTQRVFRSAIDALHGLGQHFLPQLPLVLQMPTRLIVSQQFLHDLAALLIRDGWRSVAFELPSTHQLYSHSVEKDGADAAWCQLPLLCTPWASLCRHPRLGQTLRQLRRHDAVPFHVLYSWAVSEMQLFSGLEQSIVVDTTAPMPGEEAMYAYLQSPSSVGQTAEELHCAQPQHTRQLCDVTDAALSPCQAAGHADGTRVAVYMSENPTRTHGVGPGFFNDVVDAVRQRSRSAASREYNRADLDRVYDELRLRRHTDTDLPSAASKGVANSEFVSPDDEGSVSLVLDSPPDYLRALIEKSIVDSDVAVRPAPSERHRLLQKVGEFLQHTMVEPSVSGSGDAASPSSSATCKAHENASLEQEAGELERLLREANETRDATTAGSDVEQMMAEMQQSIRAYTQLSSCDTKDGAEERACHQPSLPHRRGTNGMHNTHAANSATASNAWSTFPGYWSCIHALVQQFTYPTLLWTAPTFNKAAVRGWAAAYHASRYSSGGYDETHMSTRGAPLPLVVPVYMPAQSVMHVEVERLLREGRWFERPPLLRGREEETALHTWLPASLNAALADALSKLPSDYQACERRRLLLDHQRLRREGAHGARRCSTVMEVADTSPTSSAIAGDETGLDTVRIHIHQETRPLYLLTPAQVQRRESQAFKEAAAMCAASQEAHATLDRGRVRGIHDSFVQAVEESYRAISPASEAPLPQTALPVLFLHVPTPGLDVDELCRSSRCLSA